MCVASLSPRILQPGLANNYLNFKEIFGVRVYRDGENYSLWLWRARRPPLHVDFNLFSYFTDLDGQSQILLRVGARIESVYLPCAKANNRVGFQSLLLHE